MEKHIIMKACGKKCRNVSLVIKSAGRTQRIHYYIRYCTPNWALALPDPKSRRKQDMSNFPAKERALGMYREMYKIRMYEESIYYLFLEGIMPGTIHQSTGEEASAVGMLYDLRKDDWMASTHRPAGHDLAKGMSLKSMMCEMFGKADGCCGGKGGAMHTGDITVGAMVANAIVGGNLPIAAGVGLAFKTRDLIKG